MKVKFKKAHNQYKEKEIAEIDDNLSKYLIRCGVASQYKQRQTKELKKPVKKK